MVIILKWGNGEKTQSFIWAAFQHFPIFILIFVRIQKEYWNIIYIYTTKNLSHTICRLVVVLYA